MEKKRKKKRRRDHLEFLLTHNDNLAIDTCLVRTWSERVLVIVIVAPGRSEIYKHFHQRHGSIYNL